MILNLNQHKSTPEQGVTDLAPALRDILINLLTVDALPTASEVEARCADIAYLASEAFDEPPKYAMIGGAPWMMARLERALIERGIEPLYAFSVRESTEEVQADGSVRKVAVFKHAGFIPAR